MLSKLKDLKVILVILLVLSWIGAGVGGYVYHTSKTNQLTNKDSEIETLQTSINQVGELVNGYSVTADVETGKKIEEEDIQAIQVPLSMATNLVQDREEILGKHFRVDLKEGTALTEDLLYTEEITDDLRLYDVVLDTIPVGLEEGSFVDIRITLPMGEDFIAMAHKKVHQINGGVLKIGVTEHDIHSYNSMLIDSLVYPGTNMYAIEYIEGGVQSPSEVYYPISTNVTSIAQRDPNLLQAIKSDILLRRSNLEKDLAGVELDTSDVEDEEKQLDAVLDRGRQNFRQSYMDAELALQARLAAQALADGEEVPGVGGQPGTSGGNEEGTSGVINR